ncbi:PREDICTED: ankyrin repeat domain-containing protein, chloroplastic isoform X1 [Camelina sativa]|uniref:Ankyrin repeat domain-containing protein, chloroplastic isoform X1 n=1 Tax=Camelina sativa TaxID=90675 RepID=A0ABM0W5H5_CAMSA|nr:PREDICTED: ankyrin repeat domain-containing protein, chloroplastic isoform X1 [Camelina sativa]XP_019094756.1 PREDICTED: ankyrin repeat domain-containing protein, chloroplastic isoform X1 [Camelina sativa]
MQLAAPHTISLLIPSHSPSRLSPSHQSLVFPRRLRSLSYSSQTSILPDAGDDFIVGDCLVYEDGVFEDPYLLHKEVTQVAHQEHKKKNRRVGESEIEAENLVPEEWRDIQAEVNLTKKDKRKIAQELEFGVRVEKKRQGLVPLRSVDLNEFLTFKEAKLAQLRPVTLDKPGTFSDDGASTDAPLTSSTERVAPKNPRWAVYGKGFDHVTNFFNSDKYDPTTGIKSDGRAGPRKLLSKEEKFMLNSRNPDLAVATSKKWLPLHTLAACGEFYLVDSLLKHNLDINATDVGGLTALHRAIIGKKQAVTNYLLRESANPFVLDDEGATLMHYAVQTASAPTIKLLLLYNADINAQDRDGWTPLHVAVQARRSDIAKLLLIKGADVEVKNKDGLTPLGLCLYMGRETRTYEMMKMLKEFPSSRHKKRLVSRDE